LRRPAARPRQKRSIAYQPHPGSILFCRPRLDPRLRLSASPIHSAEPDSGPKEEKRQKRDELRKETEAALDKVAQSLGRASAEVQSRARQLKEKVESDIRQLKQRAGEARQEFEALQAENYAEDKEADAEASVAYAVAAVKMAELAVLEAIDARLRADSRENEFRPAQPSPA
jgi:hypothetical protein